jgi:PAS domain S-box-containing protein
MTAARWSVIILLVIGAGEVVTTSAVVLLPFVGIAPLLAASDGPRTSTAMVGVLSVAVAIASGPMNDLAWTTRHNIGILATVIVSVIAWRLATFRTRREAALRDNRPHVERSLRLASAMAAGDIGEWWFDAKAEVARWDESTRRLLGLAPDHREGSFAELVENVHHADRERLESAVLSSSSTGVGFRSDHRVRTADGSLHWIELVGEPLADNGTVTGVVGLVQSTDERHREVEQRDRLLSIEATARNRAEFLERVYEVLAHSIDVEEILDHVTRTVVPDLADCAGIVLTIDRSDREPLIVAHHVDPEADRLIGEHLVADPSSRVGPLTNLEPPAPWTAANRGVVIDLAEDNPAVPEQVRRWADLVDVGSVLSVPIVGPLGVLGVLHLMRGTGRPHPSPSEIELAQELASRTGAALNAAVLYTRLAANRALLQTLQQVTGELAGAATVGDVTRAVLGEGRRAMGAMGAALFVVDHAGALLLQAADGVQVLRELEDIAECARRESRTIDGALDGHGLMAVAVPLFGSAGTIGVLEFLFEEGRLLTGDEVATLDTLGSRVAVAVERAATYDRDHDIALVLQRRLLPDLSHAPPWLEVAAHYEPATGGPIGGDWYQLVDLGDGRVAAVVGDAVGHGLVSAAAMGQLRASATTALTATRDPASALAIVDRFADLGPDTIGASLGIALIHYSGTVTMASAGHPPLMLVPRSGAVRMLEGGRRPLLGYGHHAPAVSQFEHIGVGDTLVLYSDGLIERRRRSFDAGLFELRSILDGLRDLDVDVVCREVIERMSVQADAEDDVAVMVVRRVAGRLTRPRAM